MISLNFCLLWLFLSLCTICILMLICIDNNFKTCTYCKCIYVPILWQECMDCYYGFFFNVVSSIFAIALYETSANNDKAYHWAKPIENVTNFFFSPDLSHKLQTGMWFSYCGSSGFCSTFVWGTGHFQLKLGFSNDGPEFCQVCWNILNKQVLEQKCSCLVKKTA